MDAVIYCSSVALAHALDGPSAERLIVWERARLNALLVSWSNGGDMDRAEFAEQFLGRTGDDPVATALRTAALTAKLSGHPDALHDAGEHLAKAMLAVGLDLWRWFLEDARERANEPSTVAALEKSQKRADPRDDAIRPVYPVETAFGIAAAGAVGGVAAGIRAGGAAILRQLLPERPAVANERLQAPVSARSNDQTASADET
jgi:hypothetical protein